MIGLHRLLVVACLTDATKDQWVNIRLLIDKYLVNVLNLIASNKKCMYPQGCFFFNFKKIINVL